MSRETHSERSSRHRITMSISLRQMICVTPPPHNFSNNSTARCQLFHIYTEGDLFKLQVIRCCAGALSPSGGSVCDPL